MKPPSFENVYQFKITLCDIKPMIWRRILVPENYTFWDLHLAIQDAMGWEDCHLHEFEVIHPSSGLEKRIGIPDEEWGVPPILPDWEVMLSEYFKEPSQKGYYEYDFGDRWRHLLEFEKILTRDINIKYPSCIEGKRACPPEDCGGAWGYKNLLSVLSKPHHPEYARLKRWVGRRRIDPENFYPQGVHFYSPKRRLSTFKRALAASEA
jgi:hypothetical protein